MNAKKNTTKTTPANDPVEVLATLKIARKVNRPVGGTWVVGTIAGHAFEALVFPEHAGCESYEISDSRISKLFIETNTSHLRETVACFDRGWDLQPTTPAARLIVELLAEGLAETVFGK